jgi:phosphoglycolate phosphatase
MPDKHIIFDLDGTLIDSSESILSALDSAFDRLDLQPIRSLTADIIGPPLLDTLSSLTNCADKIILERLASEFKSIYDNETYSNTKVFPGVYEMLNKLSALGYPMYIATNKRAIPTIKIISYLGWPGFFQNIFALDQFNPIFKNKAEMLERILLMLNISPHNAFYIGDRHEDALAAQSNKLPFIMASWGYADSKAAFAKNSNTTAINVPGELFSLLNA